MAIGALVGVGAVTVVIVLVLFPRSEADLGKRRIAATPTNRCTEFPVLGWCHAVVADSVIPPVPKPDEFRRPS
jgi:hypothetical protein